MKAVCWQGTKDVRVLDVPDPKIQDPTDAIVKVTLSAICGSDLHLYNGLNPEMKKGDVLGHEFMGEVVEVGRGVAKLAPGDRVVVPFAISCGQCFYCRQELYSLCERTNPDAEKLRKLYGGIGGGLFGYSHLYGGFPGGQAQYVRVPYADVGPIKIPPNLSDEKVLFLSDIFPTGYQAAENCAIKPGHIVAVWGCGPVGQFAIQSAYLLGAERVIAIDSVPERLRIAETVSKAVPLAEDGAVDRLRELTGGEGPHACIDAVGIEAHGSTFDELKQAMKLQADRPQALRQAIHACRKGGVVSVPGVYVGHIDDFPIGAAFNKCLTFRLGQTHVQRYMRPLLKLIEEGRIDPSAIITDRVRLEDAPGAYEKFNRKQTECLKVVIRPN